MDPAKYFYLAGFLIFLSRPLGRELEAERAKSRD